LFWYDNYQVDQLKLYSQRAIGIYFMYRREIWLTYLQRQFWQSKFLVVNLLYQENFPWMETGSIIQLQFLEEGCYIIWGYDFRGW